MAHLTIHHLDDNILKALEDRAARHGITLEEEIRATLTASVTVARVEFATGAAALRATTSLPPPHLDSARILREERDAAG